MSQVDRFQDALEELAKLRSVGNTHHSYMAGYLIGLLGEMARQSPEAQRLLERSLRDTEAMLFRASAMTEVDAIA